jgi:hypothetical protein
MVSTGLDLQAPPGVGHTHHGTGQKAVGSRGYMPQVPELGIYHWNVLSPGVIPLPAERAQEGQKGPRGSSAFWN